MEYRKIEVFHFSRLHKVFNPPLLDLILLGDHVLHSKSTWWYLEFIFNWKLLFWQHIDFYTNKAISIVKYMKMLENSSRSLISIQKRWLYRCCILPIALYSFQLWYYNKTLLAYFFKELRKMQRRVALWISSAFHTFTTSDIKVITGLISIHLYLQKLGSRSQLRVHFLPLYHIIKLLLEIRSLNNNKPHQLLLENLTLR